MSTNLQQRPLRLWSPPWAEPSSHPPSARRFDAGTEKKNKKIKI